MVMIGEIARRFRRNAEGGELKIRRNSNGNNKKKQRPPAVLGASKEEATSYAFASMAAMAGRT
jgi:hypothetical protein